MSALKQMKPAVGGPQTASGTSGPPGATMVSDPAPPGMGGGGMVGGGSWRPRGGGKGGGLPMAVGNVFGQISQPRQGGGGGKGGLAKPPAPPILRDGGPKAIMSDDRGWGPPEVLGDVNRTMQVNKRMM